MKQKIGIAAFLAVCITIISFAIKAGQHHDKCRQCKLSFGKAENGKR
jgi:hypothetical protein